MVKSKKGSSGISLLGVAYKIATRNSLEILSSRIKIMAIIAIV
jgi:hypothetical protein